MTETEIKTSITIDKIKDFLDNQADTDDVIHIFCYLFPEECNRIQSDGFNRCKNMENENCIECTSNDNSPFSHAEKYTKDHFEDFG